MEIEIGRRKFTAALGFDTGGGPADGYPEVGFLVRSRQSS
jgi:hypothetical protein